MGEYKKVVYFGRFGDQHLDFFELSWTRFRGHLDASLESGMKMKSMKTEVNGNKMETQGAL